MSEIARLIGTVAWEEGRSVAERYDDGSWRVLRLGQADPAAGRLLQAQYGGADWSGPELGHPGVAALRDLAERMGGTVAIEEPAVSEPPGTVY